MVDTASQFAQAAPPDGIARRTLADLVVTEDDINQLGKLTDLSKLLAKPMSPEQLLSALEKFAKINAEIGANAKQRIWAAWFFIEEHELYRFRYVADPANPKHLVREFPTKESYMQFFWGSIQSVTTRTIYVYEQFRDRLKALGWDEPRILEMVESPSQVREVLELFKFDPATNEFIGIEPGDDGKVAERVREFVGVGEGEELTEKDLARELSEMILDPNFVEPTRQIVRRLLTEWGFKKSFLKDERGGGPRIEVTVYRRDGKERCTRVFKLVGDDPIHPEMLRSLEAWSPWQSGE